MDLIAGGWERRDVAVPLTFIGRWNGLAASPTPTVLIRGSSVHTVGAAGPLSIVALDRAGAVLSRRVVPPARVWVVRSAAWMLELPPADPGPPLGHRVEVVASSL